MALLTAQEAGMERGSRGWSAFPRSSGLCSRHCATLRPVISGRSRLRLLASP